jgi:DNA-directed RNA polymerase II subunit RPB1
MSFSFRRTSPYFSRCDISPESRGFVGNSYLSGLTVWEFFYISMQARVDILNKSFLISDAGD